MTDKLNDVKKMLFWIRSHEKTGESNDIAKAVGFLCSENAIILQGRPCMLMVAWL